MDQLITPHGKDMEEFQLCVFFPRGTFFFLRSENKGMNVLKVLRGRVMPGLYIARGGKEDSYLCALFSDFRINVVSSSFRSRG